MATIIKSRDRAHKSHGVAFNFEDMAIQAGKYLESVRANAAGIIAEAQQQAAGIRQTAEAEGRKAGERAHDELLEIKVAQTLETALPAVRQAAAELQQAKQAWLAKWEQSAVHLAAAMAARVIRQELARSPQIPLELVREGLDLAAGSAELRIHMSPADQAALGGEVERLIGELSMIGSAAVVSDPAVSTGGCRIETKFGVIDQQFEAQLARIEQELT
jgi:flagellar assembly protein FliH